jgi:glycosyltransferase involved in cell wall biosynthesis
MFKIYFKKSFFYINKMKEITEEYINNRYDYLTYSDNLKELKNNKLKIIYNNKYKSNIPYFSIVIPVYNQENIIVNNIKNILENTISLYYEIIIIVDSCSDNTELILLNYFNNVNINYYNLLTKVLIIKSDIPLFETTCDNIGFYCSNGKYIIEIQSDIEIREKGYNIKMLKPFLYNTNIIGVSGRCCHSFDQSVNYGLIGTLIEIYYKNVVDDVNSYYISETCNRGPLMLQLSKLKEMNYLDESNFFLDDSDHDLFARSYNDKKYLCCYVPIDINAPLQNGSTRKEKDELNKKYYEIYKNTRNGQNGFLKLYKTIKEKAKPITKYKL